MSIRRELKSSAIEAMTWLYFFLRKKPKIQKFTVHAGSEDSSCSILLNGPSLTDSFANSAAIKFIASSNLMCVNSSFTESDVFQLKPNYLVFSDPCYWAPDLHDDIKKQVNKILDALKKVDWQLKIFIPSAAKKWNSFIKCPEINNNIHIIYYKTKKSRCKKILNRFCEYQINKTMPSAQNVLSACIYILINAGYKKIFIFGADHSWHQSLCVNDDNIPCIQDKHFYDDQKKLKFEPIYRDAACRKIFTMRDIFKAYMTVHESYYELNEYAGFMGSKIYNSSSYSCIDAFTRYKF